MSYEPTDEDEIASAEKRLKERPMLLALCDYQTLAHRTAIYPDLFDLVMAATTGSGFPISRFRLIRRSLLPSMMRSPISIIR